MQLNTYSNIKILVHLTFPIPMVNNFTTISFVYNFFPHRCIIILIFSIDFAMSEKHYKHFFFKCILCDK